MNIVRNLSFNRWFWAHPGMNRSWFSIQSLMPGWVKGWELPIWCLRGSQQPTQVPELSDNRLLAHMARAPGGPDTETAPSGSGAWRRQECMSRFWDGIQVWGKNRLQGRLQEWGQEDFTVKTFLENMRAARVGRAGVTKADTVSLGLDIRKLSLHGGVEEKIKNVDEFLRPSWMPTTIFT